MRKLLSLLVIALFFIGMIPSGNIPLLGSNTQAAAANKKGTAIALRFYPAHSTKENKVIGCTEANFSFCGADTCEDTRSFPWEKRGTNFWGRYAPNDPANSYLMPNAAKAKDMGGTPNAVHTPGAQSTNPKWWSIFYLDIQASGGSSQEKQIFYAVIDDAGQLWLDPDGMFNDPRYLKSADPQSDTYIPGSATSNIMSRVDPIRSNNTLGPYILNLRNPDFKTKVYFWDRDSEWYHGTDRFFRIGWVDRPEYYGEGAQDDDGKISNGLVQDGEWEICNGVNWAWDPFLGQPALPSSYVVNVKAFPITTYFYDSNGNNRYDTFESIYMKGAGNTATSVEPDDIRLSPATMLIGEETYSYPASSMPIIPGDKDISRALHDFQSTPGSMYETRYLDANGDSQYSINEYIYRVYGNPSVLKTGDVRLTNVSAGGKYLKENALFSTDPIFGPNDVLLLNEVLEASCDNTLYDITLESNVWLGSNPSQLAGVLRTPNQEFDQPAQRIQKNTVLDPEGNQFEVPASTFHDIPLHYRSYIGVQWIKDSGIDNNFGANLPGDTLLAQSLSDEYRPKRTGEEFLGANNANNNMVPDFGHGLTVFKDYILFHDTTDNGFGCGETLYQKYNNEVPSTPDQFVVQTGDIRLTPVSVDFHGNEVQYPVSTTVQAGDADIGLSLSPLYTIDSGTGDRLDYVKYYDEFILNRLDTDQKNEIYVTTGQFEPHEEIYYDKNLDNMVDLDDTRLTEVEYAGIQFECGSKIEQAAEYWFNQSRTYMIPMGLNGDARFIDIEVLPGKLNLDVNIDKPLKVEQTSTIKITADQLNLRPDEKIFISVREPKETLDASKPEPGMFEETVIEDGQYIGITPSTKALQTYDTWNYYYFGENMYSYYYYEHSTLWGTGTDGFQIGGISYAYAISTEDGQIALYRSTPSYYPYSYRYEYQYGQYGGRPYPYSAGLYNLSSYCYGYWMKDYTYYYYGPYKPWDEMLLLGTWIMPFSGQWHIPVDNYYTYPGYYRPMQGYGMWYEKTNEYLRIVWKICTQPGSSGYNATYNGPNISTQLRLSTSEFECIIYRSGSIQFNYSNRNQGYSGMNIYQPNVWLYNNDADRGGDFKNPDPDPLNAPYQYVTYRPLIGVSSQEMGKYQLSKYSYPYTTLPSFRWLEGKTIMFSQPEKPDVDLYNQKIFTAFGEISKDHPVYEFQYTPYRGSCNDGFHGKDGFFAGTSIFNQLEIRAFIEKGGVKTPVPMDSDYTGSFDTNYRDPHWIRSKFNKAEYQENYRKEPAFVIPPIPLNTMPDDIPDYYNKQFENLRNRYDCYTYLRYDIAPEDLVIEPSVKCLDLVSSRFPNFSFTVKDADNPNDVNDPANLEFKTPRWFAGSPNSQDGTAGREVSPDPDDKNKSKPLLYPGDGKYDYGKDMQGNNSKGSYGYPLIMNFNAHGAGINYLFTAQIGGDGANWRRYIVQVNMDGTYEFWRWYEADLPGQVFGALDQHDMLYTVRGYYIPQGGQWDPVSGNTNPYYKVFDSWRLPASFLEDMDASIGQGSCDYLDDMFPPIGDVTMKDRYGMFGSSGLRGNPAGDPCWYMPYHYNQGTIAPTAIQTFGVPVVIMSEEPDFKGGIGLGVANPKNMDSPLTIRLYSTNTIFDYNSTISHPPYFTYDKGEGIDYLGYYTFRILPQDPVVNFTDMNIFDRSLQLSQTNYTSGAYATSRLQPPTPQIKADYDPVLRDWSYLRCYPGGQTHTGRAVSSDPSVFTKGSGRNAYPAIYDMHKKLGTEFFPLTDYVIAFNLRDAEKNHYSFDPRVEQRSQLAKVIVKGPFMFPKMYDEPSGKIDTSYRYKNVDNVPIQYDTSGYLEITANNQALWEVNGIGLNRIINPYRATPSVISYANKNKYARYTHSMYYGGIDSARGGFYEGDRPPVDQTPSGQYYYFMTQYANLYFYSPTVGYIPSTYPYVPNTYMNYDCKTFILDELIPTGPGKIEITVETANGATKTYQDCCQDNITDGITVDALGIKMEKPQVMMVDADNSLDLLVTEQFPSKYDPAKPAEEITCNNAVLVAWQDRGALDGNTGAVKGAGDGWMTNPPRSSDYTVLGTSYLPTDDLNDNGKVSFNDWETEIIGTYDLATNTWSSGIIDGRTFMRSNGQYHMEFTQNNGSRLDTIGVDFGGLNVRQTNAITNPDGVIGDDEVLPIIVNAYKYGDDNNDRGSTPFYNLSGEYPQYSHEVYLSGRIEIPIESQQDYSVSLIPDILTAGVQPELQDPTEPLTFLVSDNAGIPVDILKDARKMIQDVKEEDIDPISMKKAIWNNLFKDPHPEPVPQYYWTRIDLHNDDGTQICNVPLYSGSTGRFEAIDFDMSQSTQGKYTFKGFVANDAGNFTVSVYSVDRRKVGRVKVDVVLPNVTYFVSNYDDKKKTEYEVPGEPDFVMTAGDNDIYRVRVNVKDAQGRPVKGLGRTVSICGGSALELARFTPFATPLKNYYRAIEPWFTSFYGDGAGYYRKVNMTTGNGAYSKYFWIALMFTNRWDIHFGVDTNHNGRLDAENNETERTRPFAHNYSYTTDYGYFYAYRSQGYAYYNTENFKYEDGLNDITPVFDANLTLSPFKGWGLGAIYNRPYYTPGNYGLMFANLDKRGNDVSGEPLSLSNTDSLNLDINGETEFYVFGEDVCEVGGLVGKNSWSITNHSDVAGSSWNYTISSPDRMMTRFGRQLVLSASYRGRQAFVNSRDVTYRLDWDAMPSHVVKLRPPSVEPRYADTLAPLGKSFLNENYYDLIYGQENHIQFIFLPADKRDLPLEENMKMVVAGNQVEYRVSGRVSRDPQQQEEHPSTTMYISPTGTGGDAVSLDIVTDNTRKDLMRYDVEYGSNNISQKPPPDTYYITNIARFDIVKGLQVLATSLSGPLSVNTKTQLKVVVQELGTKMPVENATVTLNGAGIKATKATDKSGVCYFDITPNSKEAILVEAKKDSYASGKNLIDIGAVSGKNDLIQLEQIPTRTNQAQYVIKGKVSSDVIALTINKTNVNVQKDGSFQFTITLKEGMNTVVLEMEDQAHRTTRKMISIELKTRGPALILDNSVLDHKWVAVDSVIISGKTEADAKVRVNNLPANQIGTDWSAEVAVTTGKNTIEVFATDELGNVSKESIQLYVYKKQRVEFFIGSKEARVNDTVVLLEEAPFISQNRTYVPLRVVSELLGAELTWNPDTRGITIRKGNQTIDMIVGSTKAVVNNQIVELDAPPVLRNGRTSVPVRFVSEYLQGSVQWNERIKMILIEFLI